MILSDRGDDQVTPQVDLASKILSLPHPLRPYQWQGVQFLLSQDSCLFADEMGLGKTVQAAVALSVLLPKCDPGRALIVVPASLRLNWERELDKWAHGLSARRLQGDSAERLAQYRLPIRVLIASYDQVREDALSLSSEVCFDIVALDEAQKIKNADSETALACRILQRRRSWAITGTPLENTVSDLVAVFRFVLPGLLNSAMLRPEMHTRMEPFFLRRHKRDVLPDLPPVIIQDVPLELGPRQREAYDQIWIRRKEWIRGRLSEGKNSSLFALITKLKQLCNYDAESGESTKLEVLRLTVEGLSSKDDKLIVFSQYVETLQWISGQIRSHIPTDIYHGGLDDNEKDAVIERFKHEEGPRLLLVSLKAGGTGLNLQEASSVILFDRWWNPAVESQAIYRAHRFDRSRVLHVIRFVITNSIEERIDDVLEKKKVLFQQYIDGAKSADVDELSRGELLKILELNE